MFAGFAAWFGSGAELPAFLYLAAVGVALALIDLDLQRLPDVLTLPSYPVGLGPAGRVCRPSRRLADVRAVIGMAALFGFYFTRGDHRAAGDGLR